MKKNKILTAGLILLFTGLLLCVVTNSDKYTFISVLQFIRVVLIGLGMAFTIYGYTRQRWDSETV
ncbi:MAG: hypothetical protein M3N30_10420 [Bacteroidota bacterium]|nr:hypothetical protein [Bacteroidota bacterium]